MAEHVKEYICDSEEKVQTATGELEGQGFTIVFGPEKTDVRSIDKTRAGNGTDLHADVWVVIGKKPE